MWRLFNSNSFATPAALAQQQQLCMTYSSSSPVVTTTSIILCFNKHQLTQVLLESGR